MIIVVRKLYTVFQFMNPVVFCDSDTDPFHFYADSATGTDLNYFFSQYGMNSA
jgi:hypothetical protein